MEAMIDNGEEWLEPLLDLRDELAALKTRRRSQGSAISVDGTDVSPLRRAAMIRSRGPTRCPSERVSEEAAGGANGS